MQKYVDQLLEDMLEAHRPEEDEPSANKEFSIEQHFEEVERWLAGEEPAHDFSYYCGLKPEQFPPEERLTKLQLKAVYKAYEQLLFSWNLDADIPKGVPLRMAYPLLISTLSRKVEIVNDGFMTFEFCNYDELTCPFKEYCICKNYDFGKNDPDMEMSDDKDLPF